MARYLFALIVVVSVGTGAFAQECLHGPGETSAQRARREQALSVARQINVAEATIVGPRTGQPRYRPLEELRNVSPTPAGFDLQFFSDGESYGFSLKDRVDPCHYAIFSDADKRVYEGSPRAQGGIVPAADSRNAPR